MMLSFTFKDKCKWFWQVFLMCNQMMRCSPSVQVQNRQLNPRLWVLVRSSNKRNTENIILTSNYQTCSEIALPKLLYNRLFQYFIGLALAHSWAEQRTLSMVAVQACMYQRRVFISLQLVAWTETDSCWSNSNSSIKWDTINFRP